ncbi:MAG: polyprenyl synthetase family protein [Methylophilaceae bacterium]|nr:polyprenyl synthetase family protein [Methylophilaceae bacterium]
MSAQTLINSANNFLWTESSLDELLIQVDEYIITSLSSNADSTQSTISAAEYAAKCHLATPGHKVRAKLCLVACLELNIKHHDMLILSAVSELLHNASLIHDDIQDMDEMRRDVETVWKRFGSNIAICAGDLLLSSAYGVLANISDPTLLPKLIQRIANRTSTVIQGQCGDIECKNQSINSLETYQNIARAKSGALLGLPIELALIFSQQDQYLGIVQQATSAFAIGYQIIDDLNDIAKDAALSGRPQSLNITFVLADADSNNPIADANALAESALTEAIKLANELPYSLGTLLVSLSNQLRGQIKHDSGC